MFRHVPIPIGNGLDESNQSRYMRSINLVTLTEAQTRAYHPELYPDPDYKGADVDSIWFRRRMTVPLHCLNLLVSSVESKATPVMRLHCRAYLPEFPSLRCPYLHVTHPAAGHTTSNSFGKCVDMYLLGMVSMSPTCLVICDRST